MFHFSNILTILFHLIGLVAIAVTLAPAAAQLAPDMWWVSHEGDTLTSRKKNGGWAPLFLQGHDWAMRSLEWKLDPETGDSGLAKLVQLEKKAAAVILRDDGARVWYLPGIEGLDAMMAHFGLIIDATGGLGKLMKRLSRLLVQFRVGGWLTGESVKVRFLNHGAVRSKAYDGSAKFSRQFVLDLAKLRLDQDFWPKVALLAEQIKTNTDNTATQLLNNQYESLMIQIAEIQREAETLLEGEFTLLIGEDVAGLDERGFWKGQATVIDTQAYDVLLPRDAAKGEVKLIGNRVFVGIKPISAHDHMTMDRQSLSNLNSTDDPSGLGFFSYDPDHAGDRLIVWLKAYLDGYKAKVDGGAFNETVNRQLGHLRWEVDSAAFLSFFLHEFIARGGDVRWFKHTLRQAYNLGLKKIQKLHNNTAYPIPGLRLYVRPASLGGRKVKRGQVAWDLERGVIYVNDVDTVTFDPRFANVHQLEQWLEHRKLTLDTAGLTPGLQPELGGYDNDDAFWVAPFIDYDGKRKALVWRSPNVPGERHIFDVILGDVPEDEGYWFKADSRRLKTFTAWTVDPEYAIKPTGIKTTGYNLESINRVAYRMLESRAAVGMYCLMLRQLVLTCGDIPATLPCGAEGVIDATSKTFDDVTGVIQWTRDMAQALTKEGRRVPILIYEEFINFLPKSWINSGQLPPMCDEGEHWIDRLTAQAKAVIAEYERQTDIDANLATPPQELFDRALGWSTPGLGFRGAYGRTIFLARQKAEGGAVVEDDPEFASDQDDLGEGPESFEGMTEAEKRELMYEQARMASLEWLANAGFTEDKWPMVLMGGMAATYIDHIALRQAGIIDRDLMEPIRDAAFFQLGVSLGAGNGRLPGLDALAIQGLVEIGILGDLRWSGGAGARGRRLIVEMRELTPLAASTVVHIRHGWFNYGIALGEAKGGLAANAQMRGLFQNNPTLVAELKMRFAQMDLRGKTFVAQVKPLQVGPRLQEKPVLVATNGKVLGILQETKGVAFDKPLTVLNAHTMNDDTWLMLS